MPPKKTKNVTGDGMSSDSEEGKGFSYFRLRRVRGRTRGKKVLFVSLNVFLVALNVGVLGINLLCWFALGLAKIGGAMVR